MLRGSEPAGGGRPLPHAARRSDRQIDVGTAVVILAVLRVRICLGLRLAPAAFALGGLTATLLRLLRHSPDA